MRENNPSPMMVARWTVVSPWRMNVERRGQGGMMMKNNNEKREEKRDDLKRFVIGRNVRGEKVWEKYFPKRQFQKEGYPSTDSEAIDEIQAKRIQQIFPSPEATGEMKRPNGDIGCKKTKVEESNIYKIASNEMRNGDCPRKRLPIAFLNNQVRKQVSFLRSNVKLPTRKLEDFTNYQTVLPFKKQSLPETRDRPESNPLNSTENTCDIISKNTSEPIEKLNGLVRKDKEWISSEREGERIEEQECKDAMVIKKMKTNAEGAPVQQKIIQSTLINRENQNTSHFVNNTSISSSKSESKQMRNGTHPYGLITFLHAVGDAMQFLT